MKLRAIRTHGDPHLEDIELDFIIQNKINEVIVITGDNCTGKSLILSSIHKSFLYIVKSLYNKVDNYLGFDTKLIEIELEIGSKIYSIVIRDGYIEVPYELKQEISESVEGTDLGRSGDIEASRTNLGKPDVSFTKETKNVVASYLPDRFLWASAIPDISEALQGGGLQSLFPIISDITNKNIQDSIILIDDIDLGLSTRNQLELFKLLQSYHLNNNNQILVTSRDITLARNMPQHNVYYLNGKPNLIKILMDKLD